MIQTGYIKETASNVTDCGTGTVSVITEYANANGNYTCDVTEFDVPFGEGDPFTVVHESDGWWTYIDGYKELQNPISLGAGSGYSFARGEAHWTSNLPTFYVWWGPSGYETWQYKTSSTSYSKITSSSFVNEDSDWYRSDHESPFYIQWVG